MSAVWSSFKRTANNPRRFDRPWQFMTGYGNIAKTKKDGLWVKYVFSLMPEKKNTFHLLYNVDQGGQTNSTLLFTPDIKGRLNQHCWTCGQINSTCCIQQCSGNVEAVCPMLYRCSCQQINKMLRNTFRKRTSQKKPRNIFSDRKVSGLFFENRTPIYSSAAPLLGLDISIYYFVQMVSLPGGCLPFLSS